MTSPIQVKLNLHMQNMYHIKWTGLAFAQHTGLQGKSSYFDLTCYLYIYSLTFRPKTII